MAIFEEVDYFNRLTLCATQIYLTYVELSVLEAEERINTQEYLDKIAKIKMYKEDENKVYKHLKSTAEDLKKFFLYIDKQQNASTNLFNVEDILSLDNKTIIKRITSRIQEDIITVETFSTKGKKERADENKSYLDYLILRTIDNDLLQAFLNINEERIQSCNSIQIKKQLIMAKYRTIFLDTSLEDTMIQNNFSICEDIFFAYPLMLNLFKIAPDEEQVSQIYHDYCNKIIEDQINKILTSTRKNEEDMTEPFIRSTILTSMLLFLTYEEKEEKLKELLGNLNTNLDGKIDMDLVNKYIIPCFYDWQNQNAKKKVLYIQLKKV